MKRKIFDIPSILALFAVFLIFSFVYFDFIAGLVSRVGLIQNKTYQEISPVLTFLCIPSFIFLIFAICYIANKQAHQIRDLELQLAEKEEKITEIIGRSSPDSLEKRCKECEEEGNGKVWQLKNIIDKMREEKLSLKQILNEKDAEIAKLEKIRACMKETGLCAEVINLLVEGKTKEDIATLLISPEYGPCSQPQVGALLHPNVSAKPDSKLKFAQRLLHTA